MVLAVLEFYCEYLSAMHYFAVKYLHSTTMTLILYAVTQVRRVVNVVLGNRHPCVCPSVRPSVCLSVRPSCDYDNTCTPILEFGYAPCKQTKLWAARCSLFAAATAR